MATSTFTARKEASSPFSTSTANSNDGSGSCVIAQGTKIEGNFQSSENVRLDGTVNGDFTCEKKLVVGRDGKVDGSIRAREAMIMGTVTGDVEVQGILQLDKTAQVKGNISAGSLSIDEGARFDGVLKMIR
jgi:cytoskeletal protein CcmA (bactofilin family)